MSKSTIFFNNILSDAVLKINTAMPCSVISYDAAKKEAKIQPLFMVKYKGQEPQKLPVLEGVPVVSQRFNVNDGQSFNAKMNGSSVSLAFDEPVSFTPHLEKGDMVFVVFAQRALDKVMSGNVAYPQINRHHDLRDAVIVGVMKGGGI